MRFFASDTGMGISCVLGASSRISWTRNSWPTHFFYSDHIRLVPYEFILIPIPSQAEEILTRTFGDWHVEVKGANSHGSLDFSVAQGYVARLIERYGYTKQEFVDYQNQNR